MRKLLLVMVMLLLCNSLLFAQVAVNTDGSAPNNSAMLDLGADYQAGGPGDGSEASAGWYWQFNRKQGFKHTGTVRTPNTTWITSISENSNWQAANDPCALLLSSGWRLPTFSEWSSVVLSGNWADWTGPWISDLKIHAAGDLLPSNGSLMDRGGPASTGAAHSTTLAMAGDWTSTTALVMCSRRTRQQALLSAALESDNLINLII